MVRIVIPDDFPRAVSGTRAEEKLRQLGEVRIYTEKAKTQEELIERLKESEVLINVRAYTHLNRQVLSSCPKLRLVSVWGTGTDNVDLQAARDLGITVTNTPGANAVAVAEHTIALLLALARQIPWFDREVRSGKWPRGAMVQLNGKVMGLIGLGAIGINVAKTAKAMGMELLAWTLHPSSQRAEDSRVRFVSKEDLLRSSDVISIHLRLSDRTRGFLKKEDFDLMKPTVFIVNTARAGLIEPGALLNALRSKKIAGAALDVFDHEPLLPGDPIIDLPNVVLTPHNAGMTPETAIAGLMMAVGNVESFLVNKKTDPLCLVVQGWRRDE